MTRGRLQPTAASAVLAALCLLVAAALPSIAGADQSRPILTIVIDDLGWDRIAGERTLALPKAVTVAILPGAPASSELAELAMRSGHEIMLHQPMEALDARWPGPGALAVEHDAREIRARLAENLAALPQRAGVSNHMGSRLTAEARAMNAVMTELAGRDLYFLDSRTTPDTVALQAAQAHDIPATRRDVFLDVDIEDHQIDRALTAALNLAETRGHALAIGHPHVATLRVLEARMAEITRRVELVPVSRMIELQETRAKGTARQPAD
ncbi:MAG: divergent polysaccharide deacetylase family protein [Pseudomonadales bacterium]|nr:divergent polysaccharide deacetylase family protein [Pseudomonadales bacterium]